MGREDTGLKGAVKSLTSAFVFNGIAMLSDAVNLGISKLHIFSLQGLIASVAGPQVLVTGAVSASAGVIDSLFGSKILESALGVFVGLFSIQLIISLLTLCLFYAFVLTSPKGTYTTLDCIIAAGVFLLSSVPILCGYSFWTTFSVYLRRRTVSSTVGDVSSFAGNLSGGKSGTLSGGKGGGGFLNKVSKVLKK